jgi:hypothetical protein
LIVVWKFFLLELFRLPTGYSSLAKLQSCTIYVNIPPHSVLGKQLTACKPPTSAY